MSRADLHVHSTASQLSKLGSPALAAAPGVRHRPCRGLRARQAPRDGLRDDHRSRHDRRRAVARPPARHVHLRGADRFLQGRAAGRARALLRHHAGRSRVAAGPQRRRRGVRGVPARARHHRSARAPLLRRRRAAHGAPPAAPGRSCSRSGRRATARAPRSSTCRRSSTSRPTGAPRSAAPTTTPESTSAARSPRRPRATPRRSSSRTSAPGAPPPTASRAAPRSGPTRRWRSRSASLGDGEAPARPDPATVLKIVERVMCEGDARHGSGAARPRAERCARAAARVAALDGPRRRRAQAAQPPPGRRAQPRRPRPPRAPRPRAQARRRRPRHRRGRCKTASSTRAASALALFDACVPAIPYAAAAAFLGREKAKLTRSDGDRPRVALVADGIGAMHGVTHTIEQIRDRGVRGLRGRGDRHRPRRRPAAQRGGRDRCPLLPGPEDRRAERPGDRRRARRGPLRPRPRVLARPGRHRRLAAGRVLELPLVGSYHTELGRLRRRCAPDRRSSRCSPTSALRHVLRRLRRRPLAEPGDRRAPGRAGDRSERIGRWDRGVDLAALRPGAAATRTCCRGEVNVLYAGRLTKEKGVELLADAFLEAHRRDPRLHLVLAGGGPEEELLRERLGEHATFLGWLSGDDLARAYASADVVPVRERDRDLRSGGPRGAGERPAGGRRRPRAAPRRLIDHGETGLLAAPEVSALADGVISLTTTPRLHDRVRRGALAGVRGRSWEAALDRLAAAYRVALAARTDQRLERGVA